MSEAKKSKKPTEKHITDVEEPGKSAPSSTSKPVIVTNRPILKDPMVVEDKSEAINSKITKTASSAGSSGKPKIKPLTAPVLEGDGTAETPSDKPEAVDSSSVKFTIKEEGSSTNTDNPKSSITSDKKSEKSIPEVEETKDNVPEATEKTTGESTSDKTAAEQLDTFHSDSNESAESSGKPKNSIAKQAETEAAEQAKHDAAIQKLIDSKKYALPINAVEKRKTKHFIVLGLLLAVLLALVWADIALDAGIIHTNGIKPVTHFFSN